MYSVYITDGDGSTTSFPISFTLGFLSRSDITCRVGQELTDRTFEWVNDGLVTLDGDPPGLGVPIVFTRTVTKTQLIHDYAQGEPIEESNLDDSNKQLMMIMQEVLDGRLGDFVNYLDKYANLADLTDKAAARSNLELGTMATESADDYATLDGLNDSMAAKIHGATSKTTPVDADELPIIDSAASNVLKKLTWANLKATMKTATDALYQPLNAALTGLATLTGAASKIPMFSGTNTASLLDFKDEDDMASDSATAVASQQSTKAYVDAAITDLGPVGSIGGVTGSTDNRLIRADGAGGATIQGSSITVDDSGNMNLGAGNVLTSGTVDGRDVSTDGTKLDGIASSADVTSATNVGSSIHGATAKTTPVDADEVPLIDTAASNVLKKSTWTNIKAFLKTYFDTLYQPLATNLTAFAAKTAPSGTVVGTTDVQSLTNKKLGSLTTNGFVKTSAGDGTLSVDTTDYTMPDLKLIGKYYFADYLRKNGLTQPYSSLNSTTWGTQLQNALLDAQQQFFTVMKSASNTFDNLTFMDAIEFVVNVGRAIPANVPVIVPRYIALNATGQKFIRAGSAGSITDDYTGDTTTAALANLYRPFFQFVPGAHNIGELEILLYSGGTDRGSGVNFGRTWSPKTMTLSSASGCSGWAVNDTFTVNSGDTSAPYKAAVGTVSAVTAGVPTAITFSPTRWSGNEVYPLPPVLQQLQWTTANGYSVFSGTPSSGIYTTTRKTGTGTGTPTVTMTWYKDWESGNSTYHGMYSTYTPKFVWGGRLMIDQGSGSDQTDATYGNTHAMLISAYDFGAEKMQALGTDVAVRFSGTDIRVATINAVQSGITLKMFAGSSMICPIVVSDTARVCDVQIDKYSNFVLKGDVLNNGANAAKAGVIEISQTDTTGVMAGSMEFTMYNGGSTTGIPAISLAHVKSFDAKLIVSNKDSSGTPFTLQNTSFVNLGSGVDAETVHLSGSIDNLTGLPIIGTATAIKFDVQDGRRGNGYVSGRAYGPNTANFGTANQFIGGSSKAINVAVPVYFDKVVKIASLASEITTNTATSATTLNHAIYHDLNGVPGALIVDAGASGTGNITVAIAFTGVKVQAIQSASQPVLAPGWYWLVLQLTAPTSGTIAQRAINVGSAGYTMSRLGTVLTDGSAKPNDVTGVSFQTAGSGASAFPTPFGTPTYQALSCPTTWAIVA